MSLQTERSKTTTLLIHGPFTFFTIFTLYKYKDLYNIIVVGPTPDVSKTGLMGELNKLVTEPSNNISVLLYGDVMQSTYNNRQNKFLHFFSVSLGLEACVTDFVIKVRSDEFYSDLEYFDEQVRLNPDKITTNDVFFRNIQMPFHPSDHLMGGALTIMKKTFNMARDWCKMDESNLYDDPFIMPIKTNLANKSIFIAAEQYLGISAVKHMIEEVPETMDNKTIIDLMKTCFHIVPTTDLGFFRVMFNSSGQNTSTEYMDDSFFSKEKDVNDITQYGVLPKG